MCLTESRCVRRTKPCCRWRRTNICRRNTAAVSGARPACRPPGTACQTATRVTPARPRPARCSTRRWLRAATKARPPTISPPYSLDRSPPNRCWTARNIRSISTIPETLTSDELKESSWTAWFRRGRSRTKALSPSVQWRRCLRLLRIRPPQVTCLSRMAIDLSEENVNTDTTTLSYQRFTASLHWMQAEVFKYFFSSNQMYTFIFCCCITNLV